MEWYNVVLLLLGGIGGIGGVGGFIAIYKARSEKTSIDIHNLSQMLEEARKMYNTMCDEKEQVKEDFDTYKKDNMQYISEFKERFSRLENRVGKAEDAVFRLKGAIYRGYRCKYPDNIEDCPVIKEYEKMQCGECQNEQHCNK